MYWIPVLAIIIGYILGGRIHIKTSHMNLLKHFVVGLVICSTAINFIPKITNVYSTKVRIIATISIISVVSLLLYLQHTTMGKSFPRIDNKDDNLKVANMILDYFIPNFLDSMVTGFFLAIAIIEGGSNLFIFALSLALSSFLFSFNSSYNMYMKEYTFKEKWLIASLNIMSYILGIVLAYSITTLSIYNEMKIGMVGVGISVIYWIALERLLRETELTVENHTTTATAFYLGMMTVIIIRWMR